MAMITCPECGKEISDKAPACISCGCPIVSEVVAPTQPKKSIWKQALEEGSKKIEAEKAEKLAQKERVAQMDRDGIAYCPKCKSTSLTAHKKGFGIGKAVVGAALTAGIGLVAGNIGARKVRVTCLKCGHQFWAGKK